MTTSLTAQGLSGYYKNASIYATQQLHISADKARHVMALDAIKGAVERLGSLTRLCGGADKESAVVEPAETKASPAPIKRINDHRISTCSHIDHQDSSALRRTGRRPQTSASETHTRARKQLRKSSVMMRGRVDSIAASLVSPKDLEDGM